MATVEIDGSLAIIHFKIMPAEIPDLLDRHQSQFPRAVEREEQGKQLIARNFPDEASMLFVRAVCEWGMGHRNVGRVLENGPSAIAQALRAGYALAMNGQISAGVEKIQNLKRLGQSFASKQMRFLVPDRAVILDEVIRSRIGYPETSAGYDLFLAEVQDILRHVRVSEHLPKHIREKLRVADIEAAIYTKLQSD